MFRGAVSCSSSRDTFHILRKRLSILVIYKHVTFTSYAACSIWYARSINGLPSIEDTGAAIPPVIDVNALGNTLYDLLFEIHTQEADIYKHKIGEEISTLDMSKLLFRINSRAKILHLTPEYT